MLCTLWVVFQALAVAVEAGVLSASAEALAKLAANNNGAAAGTSSRAGTQTGIQPHAQPLLARLIQLGGSYFLQPVGTQVGQFPLIPVGTVQPAGTLLVGQSGVHPLQEQLAQGATGGMVTLLAVLPQGGAGGDPQAGLLKPDQASLLPAATLSNQQHLAVAATPAGGKLRFQRSVGAPVRRMRSPELMMTAEEEEEPEEEEECSGIDTDDDAVE